jgi:hypothetical protein
MVAEGLMRLSESARKAIFQCLRVFLAGPLVKRPARRGKPQTLMLPFHGLMTEMQISQEISRFCAELARLDLSRCVGYPPALGTRRPPRCQAYDAFLRFKTLKYPAEKRT